MKSRMISLKYIQIWDTFIIFSLFHFIRKALQISTAILTQHAYRGNEKLQWIILQQITAWFSVTRFDLLGDVSFHFHDIKRCNVFFFRITTYKVHVNTSVTVKDLGGISNHVMAENWQLLKDTLAFLSFLESK